MSYEELKVAEVTEVQKIGSGTRVCLDMIDTLGPDEGVLVGNTGNGYMIVLSENRETETYPARPFRINCGAHHQYIHLGEKTSYLSEMKPGMKVPVVSRNGTRLVSVGRVKMEKRNFVRVVSMLDGKEISTTLQEADSVFVMDENGFETSILHIEQGQKIMVLADEPGRHLGEKIVEEIEER